MKKVDLLAVEKKAAEFGGDLVLLNRELKRIASIKCRVKKMKGKKTYEAEMTAVLAEEQLVKEAKGLIKPVGVKVPDMMQADVDLLDYDETVKALRSIQSKKTLSRWLSEKDGDNDEYRGAVKVEKMLLEHKKGVRPVDDDKVRKSEVNKILEVLEGGGNLDKDTMAGLLRKLMEGGK